MLKRACPFSTMKGEKMAEASVEAPDTSPDYEELRLFHHCRSLLACCGDEDKGSVCGAGRVGGLVLPCLCDTMEKLLTCLDYTGPLKVALVQFGELYEKYRELAEHKSALVTFHNTGRGRA